MSELKEKKQILANVQDMIQLLEKQIADNQSAIKEAQRRMGDAHLELERSNSEIERRVESGAELAEKLATWQQQKSTLEKL